MRCSATSVKVEGVACQLPHTGVGTNAFGPSPMWQLTHSTCAGPFPHAVNWDAPRVHVRETRRLHRTVRRPPYPASKMMTMSTPVSATSMSARLRTTGGGSQPPASRPGRWDRAVPPLLQPHPGRHHQEPQHERRGNRQEDDQAGVRVSNIPAKTEITSAMNTAAEAVVITAPAIASGWRTRASNRFTDDPLLQALHVGDERIDVRRRQAGYFAGIGGFFVDFVFAAIAFGSRIHCLISSALSLVPTPSSGFDLLPLASDRVAHLALLGRVDLLPCLSERPWPAQGRGRPDGRRTPQCGQQSFRRVRFDMDPPNNNVAPWIYHRYRGRTRLSSPCTAGRRIRAPASWAAQCC